MLTNISHLNNLNISFEIPNTNQQTELYMDYNKQIYILYSLTTFIAVSIFIIIIWKIKKHICVDRNLDNKVVSLTRNSQINNDIPKDVKSASKKKKKETSQLNLDS